MADKAVPARRGVAVAYTIDPDAYELLRTLTPSRKAHGRTISELIRSEVQRREDRQRLREAILQVFEEAPRS